ncbi:MAG: 16S rRNA pseudouridine(516) synthase [Clostridia bacterium]|nr:16S rRNA pseudouridine(516) synthase [Clostridia bacterium]
MRLDKFIADGASLTRKEAREKIKKGLVAVEKKTVRDISFQVNEESSITLNNEKIKFVKYIYIMLNKPAGFVSATEDKNKSTVMDLIDPKFKRYDLFPVGRLDIDTEGFLLLTNNGELAHNILSPNKKVGKTYFVRLENDISDEDIKKLEDGVDIGDIITKKSIVERITKNEINLTITEGKFHQIKRMAHAVDNNVVYLKRLSYGGLFLDETLEKGAYKLLDEEEIIQKL